MELWDSIEFGARALMLKSMVTKPRKEIDRISQSRLEHLVNHARTHSKFWRKKFAGVSHGRFQLTDLPTSNKPELMDNFNDAVTADDIRRDEIEKFVDDESNLGKWFKGKYALSHTSGSQGQPLLLVQTKENLELLFALQVSRGNHRSIGLSEAVKHFVRPARLAAIIFNPGFYPSASAFHYMPEGARHYVEVRTFCANDNDLMAQLAQFRPTHLTAYASMLHEIAHAIEAGQLSLKPDLVEVVNISERLMPQAREQYKKIFGAQLLDNYSMGECLFLTNGCSATGGMHVNSDWALLEVVDEKNKAVPPGEKGAKVLITNLSNHVQPIIRYEIGDILTMATKPCGCGNNMPLIDHVDGRDSDVFEIPTADGTRSLQPTIFELAINRMLDVREYQIIQEDKTKFRILLEPLAGKTIDLPKAENAMHEQLKQYRLDDTLQFKLESIERLKAETDQKFKRIVSKLPKNDDKLRRAS